MPGTAAVPPPGLGRRAVSGAVRKTAGRAESAGRRRSAPTREAIEQPRHLAWASDLGPEAAALERQVEVGNCLPLDQDSPTEVVVGTRERLDPNDVAVAPQDLCGP